MVSTNLTALRLRAFYCEGMKTMTITEAYEMLPLSERTLLKWILKNKLPFYLFNDGGHPCEYYIKNKAGEDCAMVKYYKGRLLTMYGLKGVSPIIN